MAQRRPIMAGNWKMYKDHLEAIQLVQKLAYVLDERDYEGQDVVVIPPFTALRSLQTLIDSEHLPIQLGAQNCHWEDEGAFTGEVSPPMLARLDVRYVVCGHSERRHIFGETDEDVNRKVKAVQSHGMRPIVCVGETEDQRDAGEAQDVVVSQLRGSLDGVSLDDPEALVVAYEPVWAIGTGRTASAEDAQEMCATVRETMASLSSDEVAAGLRVQYGGSVKPDNVRELMAGPDLDGALVGSASLAADDFAVIVAHRR
ncbi:MAG TPA: triose-phosphate isomerase [Nitriliruptorales bacterium]|nr:triose-phosphate isomerase [Nitriliruptorales bacterium]